MYGKYDDVVYIQKIALLGIVTLHVDLVPSPAYLRISGEGLLIHLIIHVSQLVVLKG